jgi:3D (Asp-Asp-Asp) domain-containing protein
MYKYIQTGCNIGILLFALGYVLYISLLPKVKHNKNIVVTITAYRPIAKQTDNSPNFTSINTPAVMGVCAVSQDLLAEGAVNYGDLILIPNLGIYMALDTMNARHTKHIDILVYTYKQEKIIGIRKDVGIVVIENELTTN